MDSQADVLTLVESLSSQSDSTRKLAAFHLQSQVADPDFVDALVQGEGMPALCDLILQENGNTLAYSLGSLCRIVELDYGWREIHEEVPERVVNLAISPNPITVQRNALHLLSLISHRAPEPELDYPLTPTYSNGPSLETLKPLLKNIPTFLPTLITRLSTPDHALSAYALRFTNALVRDSILTFSETQLMRFVKRLQDLEMFGTVEGLMRAEGLEDDVAREVLDFQGLTKVMLRCWRFVPVEWERVAHREALEGIRSAAGNVPTGRRSSERREGKKAVRDDGEVGQEEEGEVDWVTLGFESEDPVLDLRDTGLLGLMDLADFVRKNGDFYEKTLLEQSVQSEERRCPVARVCLAATLILYELFDIGAASASPRNSTATGDGRFAGKGADDQIQPLLLSRDRLHGCVTHAFFRLWTAADAEIREFDKIEQLVRLLVGRVVGGAGRRATTVEVEAKLNAMGLEELRRWQLQDLDGYQVQAWGKDLSRLRERLHSEAVSFMQEQRIRCLLSGAWFPTLNSLSDLDDGNDSTSSSASGWRFVQLSANRRYLHHAPFPRRPENNPALTDMPQRIDVNHVNSVVSKQARDVLIPTDVLAYTDSRQSTNANGKINTVKQDGMRRGTITRLTIQGTGSKANNTRALTNGSAGDESALLELQCASATQASEWLDGLLMLLDQSPITAETDRMIRVIEGWSLQVRMLDLSWDDVDWGRMSEDGVKSGKEDGEVFSREGLDDDYYYDMGTV